MAIAPLRPALLAALLGACASTAPTSTSLENLGARPTDMVCAVQIDFGSACCGVNAAAYSAVTAYLTHARGVDRAVRWTWGREGESSICLSAADPGAADRVVDDIRRLKIPPASNMAYTMLSSGSRTLRLDPPAAKP
ncbi:hypothetical protein BH11PSE2_BH11PSE2_00780 [soil metagenome]